MFDTKKSIREITKERLKEQGGIVNQLLAEHRAEVLAPMFEALGEENVLTNAEFLDPSVIVKYQDIDHYYILSWVAFKGDPSTRVPLNVSFNFDGTRLKEASISSPHLLNTIIDPDVDLTDEINKALQDAWSVRVN